MPDYQNPQHEPGTERRLLLVFVLTFVVLIVAQPILMKFIKKPEEQAPRPQVTQPAPVPAPVPQPRAAAPKKAAEAGGATKAATAESETVIENDLYRITFTNRGAQVKSWILKKYKDEKGNPLELINAAGAPYGQPMMLWTYDEGLRTKLNSALYVASTQGMMRSPASVTFEYADGETEVRKSFQFDHTYVVKVETSVVNNGGQVQAYPAWPAGFGDQTAPASYAAGRVDWNYADKTERLGPKSISGGATLRQPFQWAGPVDQYFATVFMPDDPDAAVMITLRNTVQLPKNPQNPKPNETVPAEVLGAAVGNASGPTSERVFVGPKAYDVLQSVRAAPLKGQAAGPDLVGLVDFGKWFGFIAKPLFLWLRWTYHHMVANWGWAIIILTVVINVALLPLRISSMKSALKMQKVQPQINAIKKKYEKLPMRERQEKVSRETQELFKKEHVNPVGGCLPLLIQFPFLVAFYSMLGVAIELRQAGWFWVHDLASPDPYHALPILIIVTTVLMQKMTPTGGMDPAQQKMMTFMMPVFLGFVSWNLAAGLCLYWVVSTLVSIIQQMVMNRSSMGREMRAVAEKRARRKLESKA